MSSELGRSPSSVRRFSCTPEMDTCVGLRINPNRARTPRPGSRLSEPNIMSSTETGVDNVAYGGGQNNETKPLIEKEELSASKLVGDGSCSGFSHTVSLEGSLSGMSTKVVNKVFSLFQGEAGRRNKRIAQMVKITVLFGITVLCCGVLIFAEEEEKGKHKVAAFRAQERMLVVNASDDDSKTYLSMRITGPFYNTLNNSITGPLMTFEMSEGDKHVAVINTTALAIGDTITLSKRFECFDKGHCNLTAQAEVDIAVGWHYRWLSWQLKHEVVYAFLVLGFVYILIIFELVHRTLAALLGALAALAVLSGLNERPSLEVIVSWIDTETLTLLFGMMIIVAIFSETGFFDYSALQAYKLANGKIWPLVTLLCIFSAVVSAFLDNVTTILLMAPVTIRLCEVLNLEPRRILIAEVLFSNIGGTATAIGDPPNVIIVGALAKYDITFTVFTIHMLPGIIMISFIGYGLLRIYYRNMNELKNKDPQDISEMKQEISMWGITASRLQCVTRQETVMKALFLQKAVEIEHAMQRTLHRRRQEEERDMRVTLRNLERQYCIKDFPLLLKSGGVLCVVIVFLFIYSFIEQIYLDIGWIAVLGALWLLVLADKDDIEGIMHKIEWSTLLFFAALFILMEALSELGMITTIGDGIANLIESVDDSHRLLFAVVIILWISALASSFIDNIPFTTAMVPILQQLSDNPDVNLPLVPLVVALAFGACLGGNGTLIGASANVVCAGIAEAHGYGFSFIEFFKVGFPMMLVTTVAATVYILICHIAFDWNYV